jgi:hypothetical protein
MKDNVESVENSKKVKELVVTEKDSVNKPIETKTEIETSPEVTLVEEKKVEVKPLSTETESSIKSHKSVNSVVTLVLVIFMTSVGFSQAG